MAIGTQVVPNPIRDRAAAVMVPAKASATVGTGAARVAMVNRVVAIAAVSSRAAMASRAATDSRAAATACRAAMASRAATGSRARVTITIPTIVTGATN